MTTFAISVIAYVLATVALAGQPVTPPQRFQDAILDNGHAVLTDTFFGLEAPFGDETAFAGVDLDSGEFITGP